MTIKKNGRLGLVSVIFGALLGGCVASAQNFSAPANLEQDVWSQTPPVGKARILFFGGRIDGPGAIFGSIDMKQPADLIANGQVLGSVNYHQVLVADVAPGKYDFVWHERMKAKDAGIKSKPVPVDLHDGEIVYLTADIYQSAGSALGVVGALVDPLRAVLNECHADCQSKIKDLKIVVAQKQE